MATVKVKGSGKLFNNSKLELLTRTHPAVILVMYIPLCTYLLWYFHNYIQPSFILLSCVFLAGVFSWTFFEYILHRFLFHLVSDAGWMKRFSYIVHGIHHEYPKDKQRLVMPPVPSIILAATFFIFFRLIMGSFVFAFFSGFMIGYLSYAMIHYSMHAFRAPKNAFKFFWEYHNIHHYKHSDKAFGVSSPLWDHIFGTYPPAQVKKAVIVNKVAAKAS